MSAIVSGLIGGAIAVAVTAYISGRVGKSSVPGSLRFGGFMWAIGFACLAFSLLPIIMTVLGNNKEFWAKAGLFVGFGAAAVYCFGEVAFVHG